MDEKVTFSFPPGTEALVCNTVSGKFKYADDIRENEGKLMEVKKTPEYKARLQAYKDFISSSIPE